jgi:hypothetical protein
MFIKFLLQRMGYCITFISILTTLPASNSLCGSLYAIYSMCLLNKQLLKRLLPAVFHAVAIASDSPGLS